MAAIFCCTIAVADRDSRAQPAPTSGDSAPPSEDSAPAKGIAVGAPHVVHAADPIPGVPSVAPPRVAIMPFENRASVRPLDWLIAGVPLTMHDRLEADHGLDIAGGPLIVHKTVPMLSSESIVAYAQEAGGDDVHWVITGWVSRPNWELRINATVWRIDDSGLGIPPAIAVASAERVGAFGEYARFVDDIVGELSTAAGWPSKAKSDTAASPAAPSANDMYALTLAGRGLGRLTGVVSAPGETSFELPVPELLAAPAHGPAPAELTAALHDLTRATFIDPKMVAAQWLLGEAMLRDTGDPQAARKAISKFNYAVDLAPNYLPAVRAAADAAVEQGKRDQALELWTRVVQRRPWDLDARYHLGAALWDTGDATLATRELERVTHSRPDYVPARRVLALIHAARGDNRALISELEAISIRAPDDIAVRADLGAAYAATRRWSDSIAAYATVVAARPADVTLRKRLGDLERSSGDLSAATRWYDAAIALAPDDPRAYFAEARVLIDRGMLADAKKLLIRAQRFTSLLGATYLAIGQVSLHQNLADDAAWYLRRAVKMQPRSVDARVAVVVAEASRHDVGAAKAQLIPALAAWPRDARLQKLNDALAAAGTPTVEPPTIDLPFGDSDELIAHVLRFTILDAELAATRAQVQGLDVSILSALGQGPTFAQVAPRSPDRACPIAAVVRPWRAAKSSRTSFLHAGVELEEAYAWIARHDELGETLALLPGQRADVAAATHAFALDRADLRELDAGWAAVKRELAYDRCSDVLLDAASADPQRYRVEAPALESGAIAAIAMGSSRPPRPPRRVSFFVDNRECKSSVEALVDGEVAGTVVAGERGALVAPEGRRTMCLLVDARGTCGDRGTVRQAYLHDGWEVRMRCPNTPTKALAPARRNDVKNR